MLCLNFGLELGVLLRVPQFVCTAPSGKYWSNSQSPEFPLILRWIYFVDSELDGCRIERIVTCLLSMFVQSYSTHLAVAHTRSVTSYLLVHLLACRELQFVTHAHFVCTAGATLERVVVLSLFFLSLHSWVCRNVCMCVGLELRKGPRSHMHSGPNGRTQC